MFHIKADKRSQSSAELIAEGLFDCLEHKSFEDVTISDIQRISGVGRATFYRLFDRTEDVLSYKCDCIFQWLVCEGRLMQGKDRREMLVVFFEEWTHHIQLLNAIVQSGHIEILYQVFRTHADDIGRLMLPDVEIPSEELDYLIGMLTASLTGAMGVWLKHRQNRTAEELADIFIVTVNRMEKSIPLRTNS